MARDSKIENKEAERVGLPPRTFLYTIDQLSVMLDIAEQSIHTNYLFHEGRDIGSRQKHHMVARDISQPNQSPEWRVTDREFVRWMKVRGFRFYDRGIFS